MCSCARMVLPWRSMIHLSCWDVFFLRGELLEAEEVGEAGQGELVWSSISGGEAMVRSTMGLWQELVGRCSSGCTCHSSSQLRHLRLAYCDDRFSSGAFIEAFKNLPLLEDIHIYYTSISKEAIEVAGRCCPMLKSFKLNKQAYRFPPAECDDEALAIAENMPGIRCLQLIGNMLTNSGLQAILDRCHCLESLDLRQCLNVNIGGDIRKICAERIKELRSPYDSMEDYPFAAVIWGACYDGHEDWLELVDVDFFDNYDYDDMAIHGPDQDGPSTNSNHADYWRCFSMQFTICTSLDWLGLVVEVWGQLW
ncbi:hypothetical protein RJ639_027405 [Escallonia herrerae]|uniref:Uncharacterized protein n=1 Tax=Escallonia herrerae TaxID=1293975 RepID=A0AA89BG82_9ASTE|nr:hypothetical protein RJ639_027405 [Escallonia herrerae]